MHPSLREAFLQRTGFSDEGAMQPCDEMIETTSERVERAAMSVGLSVGSWACSVASHDVFKAVPGSTPNAVRIVKIANFDPEAASAELNQQAEDVRNAALGLVASSEPQEEKELVLVRVR